MEIELKMLGTPYGGWVIPIHHLRNDFTCYCIGAGEDISFETTLAHNFNINVSIFDPTPRAKQHFNNLILNTQNGKKMSPITGDKGYYEIDSVNLNKLKFFPYGVWSKKEVKKFYAPSNPQYVSHSITSKLSDGFFEAQCYTIKDLMEMFNDQHIDLLKMDIEGAENEVIENMFQDNIFPYMLCVEIDKGSYKENLIKTILSNKYKKLHSYGITEKFTFIREV